MKVIHEADQLTAFLVSILAVPTNPIPASIGVGQQGSSPDSVD